MTTSRIYRWDANATAWVDEHSFSGTRVGLSGTTAHFHSGGGTGTARFLERDAASGTWMQFASFGAALASLDGSRVATTGGSSTPTVHTWVRSGSAWNFEQSIEMPEGVTSSAGVDAVSLRGGHVLVGVSGLFNMTGRAYLADTACDPIGRTSCFQSALNSTNATGRIDALGSTSVVDNNITLVASLLPLNSFGFFIASRMDGLVAMPGGAQGDLCLSGSIGRYVAPGQIMNSGAIGRFDLSIDLTAMPTPTGAVAASSGETWYFQAWHRDANPANVSNFTDATSVDISN